MIVAEVDGELIAALSVNDGAVIADPFTRTAETVGLLRTRARQVDNTRRARLGWPSGRQCEQQREQRGAGHGVRVLEVSERREHG